MRKFLFHIALVLTLLCMTKPSFAVSWVTGYVLEQDGFTPIQDATVSLSGVSVAGDTLAYQFMSDSTGFYEAEIEEGMYLIWASAEGYETDYWYDSLWVDVGWYVEDIDFFLSEICYPVSYVTAQQFADSFVLVSWSMNDSVSNDSLRLRSFQYFDLFRRRFDEAPVLLASHLTDTLFMEMNWNTVGWGQYSWGVSCYYEGNRGHSDTVWSAALDKNMTTVFELDATTNVGLSAQGALASLYDTVGHFYQGVLDADGHLTLPDVYRSTYSLLVQLDGFEDFIADSIVVMDSTQIEIELTEMIQVVDSLYVSSTGWAIWQLEGERNRNLQYFEIKLNDSVVGTTLDDFFQFDVTALQPGQTCRAQVRPVYLSDTCNWVSKDWVYKECAVYQGCESLEWTADENGVTLSWTYPEDENVLGMVLYRDGEYLGFVSEDFYFDAEAIMEDSLLYCVRVVYDGPLDGNYYSMSCPTCIVADFPVYCDPPEHLEAENYWESDSDYGALVSWGNRPEPVATWLHYDDGIFKNSLGGNGDPLIFWSIRFSAEDLQEYAGMSMKMVSLFDVGAGTYQLWIYEGGEEAPRTLIHSQNITMFGSYAWHNEMITSLVEIPENEPIWVVVGQQGLSRPAAVCADMGQPDGRWVSLDGDHWTDMHTYNMHYTWMLRAFVTNRSGRTVPLENDGFVLQQYNLYRSFDNADYRQIASVSAVEGQDFYQYRDVLVGTESGMFYYKLTALYLSDEGETCESDFATSLYHPDENYVVIDDHWNVIDNQLDVLKVYPNPSTGSLLVKAEGMRQVSIFNVLGQSVLDREVQSDEAQFDLSGFADGIYQLLVTTETGFYSKRFVLSK